VTVFDGPDRRVLSARAGSVFTGKGGAIPVINVPLTAGIWYNSAPFTVKQIFFKNGNVELFR
jgi:hypothetical protein